MFTSHFQRVLALFLLSGLASLLSGCQESLDGQKSAVTSAQIDSVRLSETVRVLASDEFYGRAPGGPGEALTVNYLIERFTALGLDPAGEQGGWTQSVPLIHTQIVAPADNAPVLRLNTDGATRTLVQGTEVEFSSTRAVERAVIDDAPIVFVGHGAFAPERSWDDFGNIDLRGKLAVFLVNDPDFAAVAGEAVAGRFGGKRMTYYGRWTYKFEEAARRGALAALVVHDDAGAGYGWKVASSSPGENYSIERPADSLAPLLQGWLHNDAARDLFALAGLSLEEQRRLARAEDFEAFELEGVTLSAALEIEMEVVQSQNVLARLKGSTRPEESILVSGHWDAYGVGEPDSQGRTVRPGANDDALGIAGVIELARVLSTGKSPERSVVFAAWTAEESGLLGSEAYASQPLYPLETTVANFTLDILQTAGLARDVIQVGEGQSELEQDLARAAALQGRTVTPENLPENGLFFRADHFSLARRGVPVLLIMGIAGGADLVEGGRAAGDKWIADYTGNCYHQTCDAWSPEWDLRGAVQDIELFQSIITDLANSSRWPELLPSSEFKSIRDESRHLR
ncbi:MAG: M20/M25/M40 family metallo-hydrolase [Gammaproteobacteria bacterium]|nr:M20/M25/M40 family metallo-hydrolase [Gammaproteobacteria bacterium]